MVGYEDKGMPPAIYNKPDIVIWKRDTNECLIIDICVPLDVNVMKEEKVKRDKYLVLSSGLQRLYPTYTYKIVPIVIGATGFVPKTLLENLKECGFETKKALSIIPEMQRKALRGTMKILKTALRIKT